jgi:hypothetical protein
VYNGGDVPEWISNYNTANGTNYLISERAYPNAPYPWNNYPYDYWNLWINSACNNADNAITCLSSLCFNYEVIIFKHCFPGAAIAADNGDPSVSSSIKTTANYKLQYRALRDLLDAYPENKFIIWTLAPLHRLITTADAAARAREFVNWVKNEWLTEDGEAHPNIYIFDFYGLVAQTDPSTINGDLNCLKYEYEGSHTNSDSHPNVLANQTVGPIFAEFIVNTIEDNKTIPVTAITVTGTGGAITITSDNGTLQLSAAVSPADATNKNIVWSAQNGTGQASVSATGLVTAIADGTVIITATATDGSSTKGEFEISISNQTMPTMLDLNTDETILITYDHAYLKIKTNLFDGFYVNLYDILGNLLVKIKSNQSVSKMDLNHLSKGIYIVSILAGAQTYTYKFIKPH